MAKKPAETAKNPETFAEAAANDEATQSAPPAAPVTDVAQTPPSPKVMVLFSFVRTDGTQGQNRLFIQGMYDIRSQDTLEAIEKVIMDQSKGQYASVMITSWRALEG